MNETKINKIWNGGSFDLSKATDEGLAMLGLGVAPMIKQAAMDAYPAMITTPSITVPQQFLQFWDSETVNTLFTRTLIEELFGVANAGTWSDVKFVQRFAEPLGQTSGYADFANTDLMGMNYNYEFRSVVRFQKGILPSRLAEEQASKARIPLRADLMEAVAQQFRITDDNIGFFGYSTASGVEEPTYGILNDPNLPSYETITTAWTATGATFATITADIRSLLGQLQTQMKGHVNVLKDPIKMCVANASYVALTETTDLGYSVMQWINDTYKGVEVIPVPKFDGAGASGANVVYFIVDNVDGKKNILHLVQQKMFLVGFQQTVDGKLEKFSGATAGIFVRYPLGVVRASGC